MSKDLTMLDKADKEWHRWAKDNGIAPMNTQPETLSLLYQAFIDGYTQGFIKRISGDE